MTAPLNQWSPPNTPFVDTQTGILTRPANVFLRELWLRVGGALGINNDELLMMISSIEMSGDARMPDVFTRIDELTNEIGYTRNDMDRMRRRIETLEDRFP
jgi:hypothetical protein